MKKDLVRALSFVLIIIFISGISVRADKFEWNLTVPIDDHGAEMFTVSKDNYFVQLTIEVYRGGPVNIYVLDDSSYELWTNGSLGTGDFPDYVAAYLGKGNLTAGAKVTIEGYLGPAFEYETNSTSTGMTTYDGQIIITLDPGPPPTTTAINTSITDVLWEVNIYPGSEIPYYLVVDNNEGDAEAHVYVSILATVDGVNIVYALGGILLAVLVFRKRKTWKKTLI